MKTDGKEYFQIKVNRSNSTERSIKIRIEKYTKD